MLKSGLEHMTKEELFEQLEDKDICYSHEEEMLLRAVEIIKEQDEKIYNLQLALGMIPKGELHE